MIRPIRCAAAALILGLSACAGDYGTKQTVGTLAGAGLGGLAGASLFDGKAALAATAAGTLLGAWLGSQAGQSLDRADAVYASRAEAHAPPAAATPWRDPDSGSYGPVAPGSGM